MHCLGRTFYRFDEEKEVKKEKEEEEEDDDNRRNPAFVRSRALA